MKCAQCRKDRPDAEVSPISKAWANTMMIANTIMGLYVFAKRDPARYHRFAGDQVCRECRLVCVVLLAFMLCGMAVIGGVILWAK